MKKLLKKLPVMISLWSATAIFLIAMIVVIARPVSYGWAYKSEDKDIFGLGEDQNIVLVYDDEDEVEIYIDMDGLSFEMEFWYLRNDNKVQILYPSSMPSLIEDYMDAELMTEEEFEDLVRTLKSDRQTWREMWSSADKINAFKCEFNGEKFVCTTAIVFAVISGILVAAGITLSVLSTLAYVKDKKSKNNNADPESKPAEATPVEEKEDQSNG